MSLAQITVWGTKTMRFELYIAALAATAAFASPAMAQTTDTEQATARGTVLLPLTLTRVQDLDFGTVLASPLAGSVTIDADSGARSFGGGVTLLAFNTGQRAVFNGVGTDGQQVDVSLTPPAGGVLNRVGGGATVTISSMTLDSQGTGTAFNRSLTINDVNGAFQVGVGGTFAIAANQMNGVYQATFDVTVDY